jgi:hypothetical protein
MTWLEALQQIAPLTVVTAIVLFVAKEIAEAIRRYKSRARKASAIRTLLIEEMELNNWTIKSLRSILKDIESRPAIDPDVTFLVRTDASGKLHYRHRDSDGSGGGSSIPDVHRKHFDKFLPELAEVDKLLFEQARKGYEKLSDLEHVRTSLIANLAEEDPDEKHLEGFPSYALRVIDDVEARMSNLYVFCSGRPFEKARLR